MRCVRHEPALPRVCFTDRAERPIGERPRQERHEGDHDDVRSDQGEPDALERGLVRDLGNLFRRQVRGEIERRRQHRREPDVEDEAEDAKRQREQRDVEDGQSKPRALEHQTLAGALARRR